MNSGKKVLIAEINTLNPPEKYMQYAIELAKDMKMSVHFVHVFNPELYPIGVPYSTGDEVQFTPENLHSITKEVTEKMKLADEKIKSGLSGSPDTELTSEVGISYEIIKKYSENEEAGMVMIEGNSGPTTLSYLSDEGMDVIEKSELPVLVVPIDATYKPYKNILYASDYNEQDIVAIKKLKNISAIYQSNIEVVHFFEKNDFNETISAKGFENLIKEKTGYSHITLKTIMTETNSLSASLNSYITSTGADLIVMLKENSSFLKKIFSGSHVKSTIKHVHLPLLVFHEKHRM